MPSSPESDEQKVVNYGVDELLHQVTACCEAGRFAEAEALCRLLLQQQPDHSHANYLLGLLLVQAGQAAASLDHFSIALDKRPEHGPYWLAYIDAVAQAGYTEQALQMMQMAQEAGLEGEEVQILAHRLRAMCPPPPVSPSSGEEKVNGPENTSSEAKTEQTDRLIALYHRGELDECEALAHVLLGADAGNGLVWKVLGAVLHRKGNLQQAIAAMRRAIEFSPNDAEACNNLGAVLKDTGQLNEAETVLRQAVKLNPHLAEAANNLAVTLMASGHLKEAENYFLQALKSKKNSSEILCNLGLCRKLMHRFKEAEECLRDCLRLAPNSAIAWNCLGAVYQEQSKLTEAEDCLRKSLTYAPTSVETLANLGNTLLAQGRQEEAEACYRQAINNNPDDVNSWNGFLFAANYHPYRTAEDLYQFYRQYNEKFGFPLQDGWQPHRNDRNFPRRLRVGYVSPSFFHHPTRNFLEPLLEGHDRSLIEVFLYAELLREDKVTHGYQQQTEHWIPTAGLSDDQLASRIREDRIDILVDLAGHTGNNRLLVFARKPAPVSLHWLDFGYTTGLKAIDYYLTDLPGAPIGSEHLFSERLWRLPGPAFAYRPTPGMGKVSPLPALSNKFVTFGSLSRAIRFNSRTVQTWAAILRQVPESKLIIDSGNFKDSATQERLISQFTALGIARSRLEIGYHSPPWDILRSIDIGLDCFPHNNGTTLFEFLYMGIPFVTLAEKPSVGRIGCSVLEGVGHPEWIAWTEEEYIAIAVKLAIDREKLAETRSSLRGTLQSSDLMNEHLFCRRVEEAYQQMFELWCKQEARDTFQIEQESSRLQYATMAIEHYNHGIDLQHEAKLAGACDAYLMALNLQGDFPEALNNLGTVLQQQNRLKEAENCFHTLLISSPGDLNVLRNLGNTYKLGQHFLQAESCFRQILALQPDNVEAHYQLGYVLQEQGRLDEAERHLRQVLHLEPNHRNAFSTLLFTLNYHPDKNPEEIFTAYREFDTRYCAPLLAGSPVYDNATAPRRPLRVGYVAPDYRRHPARYFVEPLLAHHHREKVQLFAYINTEHAAESSDLFRRYTDNWRSILDLSDEEVCTRIRLDAIDILVDLAGHTAGNRLGVFARKPAPVSVHWLDFGYTTGLMALDYYLTDETTVPPGFDYLFSERPWRIATPALAYRPPPDIGSVAPLPALDNGFVTFGTLTRAARINERSVRVWSEILHRCPQARLVVNSGSFATREMREAVANRFMAEGIARERLLIGCDSPPWAILADIDIALDCFPHNSGTTLIEGLYLGVPFITLADRPSVGRLGSAILLGIGHPEWIADSEEAYIDKVMQLASDFSLLSRIRHNLRSEMTASPLMDEEGFANRVEDAFRQMFDNWCIAQGPPSMKRDKQHGKSAGNPPCGSPPASLQKHPAQPPPAETRRLDKLLHGGKGEEAYQEMFSLWVGGADHHDLPGSSEAVIDQAMQQAELCRQNGLTGEAKDLLLAVLALDGSNSEANYRLGQLLTEEETASALPYLQAAVDNRPEHGPYWLAYITALDRDGQREAAAELLRLAMEAGLSGHEADALHAKLSSSDGKVPFAPSTSDHRQPAQHPHESKAAEDIEHLLNLFGKEDYLSAEELARRLLKNDPDNGFLCKALGTILYRQGRSPEALKLLEKARRTLPNDPETATNLANVLEELGRHQEALRLLRQVTKRHPHDFAALFNAANIQQRLNKLPEARNLYRKALDIRPDSLAACCHLGNIAVKLNDLDEAQQWFEKAIHLQPNSFEAGNNLANCHELQGRYQEAERLLRQVLQHHPHAAQSWNNLGNVFKSRGHHGEAEACYRRAMELSPEETTIQSNLFFLLNNQPDITPEALFAEYQRFDAHFGIPLRANWRPHDNPRQPDRRLKIGYVSPQFRCHSTRHFLEPLLSCHDRRQVELYAYAELFAEDTVTARYRALFDHWLSTQGLDDTALAERIRSDGIDILVDLAGHTGSNRLGVFARRPSPVSLHWLDFGYTTGLSAIDYYITDPATVPPEADCLFSERPWRLETPSLVYRPAEDMGEPGPLPALTRGFVTFGTLTRAIRINHRTIKVWSMILQRLEGSRLIIDSSNFRETAMQEELAARFARHGIPSERLSIGFHSPPWDNMRQIDIALDCFPHNSGTTLVESLYMGIPYITLSDRPPVGRLGGALLEAIGHPEWIARTEEEYVELATRLASDLPGLAGIRSGLRKQVQDSPLMDEAGFARKMEEAYRTMFAKWCEEQQ